MGNEDIDSFEYDNYELSAEIPYRDEDKMDKDYTRIAQFVLECCESCITDTDIVNMVLDLCHTYNAKDTKREIINMRNSWFLVCYSDTDIVNKLLKDIKNPNSKIESLFQNPNIRNDADNSKRQDRPQQT